MPTLVRNAAVTALLAAALAACSPQESATPAFIEVHGGGFIFNYRIAETTAGLVAWPLTALPEGARIEVSFEDPAGGPPIVLIQPTGAAQQTYHFTTPALSGVEKDRAYAVAVRLLGPDGAELQTIDLSFRSGVDQAAMPQRPLVEGPGDRRADTPAGSR
jgi:hypothetical protein